MTQYTETDTAVYYDDKDDLYKKCWAADGTTHWGYFPDESVDDLQHAGWLWTEKIFAKSGIDANSRVLEIGCGNGAVSLWLAARAGCSVVGLDLSSTRIENATKIQAQRPELNVKFVCGTITDLPFEDGAFTHVWGQGVLYHVPDIDGAFAEVERVLANRGVLLIDDFVRPEVPVGEPARVHFYDRLKFDAKYTHEGYQEALRRLGLLTVESIDMGENIARTYELVVRAAESLDTATATAFRVSGQATVDREVVGYFYRCVKVADPSQWVYESESPEELERRYDAWAKRYDDDMDNYATPLRVAQTVAAHVPDTSAAILDVGCGTGLVGQALRARGYTNVHGFDLSTQMLEVARAKGCYERLFQHDFAHGDDSQMGSYATIVVAGCITHGHAQGYALARLFARLAPGGFLHLVVREDFLDGDAYLQTLLDGLRWRCIEEERWVVLGDQQLVGLLIRKDEEH